MHYDVVLIDVSVDNHTAGLVCPVADFLTNEFLADLKMVKRFPIFINSIFQVVGDNGCACFNVLCRAEDVQTSLFILIFTFKFKFKIRCNQ